jgi:N-acetylmuramoyl-L-alanine amidase
VFDLKAPVEVVSSQLVNPDRLMIELRPKGTALAGLSIAHSVTKERKIDLTAAAGDAKRSSASFGMADDTEQSSASLAADTKRSPAPRAPVTVKPIGSATVLPPPPETHPTRPVAVPARAKAALQADGSLVRMFGLKIDKIVIDAGHGGHDTGAIGPDGVEEKDVVLDIALRLGKLIRRRLGARVIYTRSTDVFVPLEERTKIANEAQADLFISIHANSSSHHSASGVETYYFNLTSDKHGLDVARRENAASTGSISQLHDLLHRAVLQAKLDESRQFAQCIQSCLWPMSRRMDRHSQDRGVRHAPFVVLIGATMPSILAEVGFISNRHDEKMLRRGSQRQKIAQALFKGIEEYADSLTDEQMASSADE